MPRLANSTAGFTTPSRDLVPFAQNSPSSTSSVRLSCLSPSGRAVHSIAVRNSIPYIETHSLPLVGTVEGENDVRDGSVPSVVRTQLPDQVCTALARYPAMELLCVDVDSSSAAPRIGKFQKIPLLCLYTKKDVFVLELGYKPSGASEVEGQVLSVTEPFEEVLMGTSTTTSIIRIRQAPQRHTGYATMCPPKSMAMLAYDSMTQEYSINLFHANEALVSRHFHGMEHLEEQTETITDFCFCQSNAFSLLSSMSVALLKGSGEVLFASPILFRGTVVPRSIVSKTLEYLQLEPAEEGSARRRQFLSAKRYLMDTFPDDGRSHFLTAQVRSLAFEWPVRVQGPVFRNFQCTESLASAIEPVVAGDLVGLCIGHLGDIVEFGLLSPTTLVPRFKLEDDADTNELDQAFRRGNIVQRVDLRDDEYNQERNNASMALICDPIIDSVVHYVTPSSIRSISTNTVKIAAAKVREQAGSTGGMFSPASKRKDMRPRTTAWSCLDINSFQDTRNSVVGAVVSDDVHLGHVLVSRLSNRESNMMLRMTIRIECSNLSFQNVEYRIDGRHREHSLLLGATFT